MNSYSSSCKPDSLLPRSDDLVVFPDGPKKNATDMFSGNPVIFNKSDEDFERAEEFPEKCAFCIRRCALCTTSVGVTSEMKLTEATGLEEHCSISAKLI